MDDRKKELLLIAGSAVVFACGFFITQSIANNKTVKLNEKIENRVLSHAANEKRVSESDCAYIITDDYLLSSKGINVEIKIYKSCDGYSCHDVYRYDLVNKIEKFENNQYFVIDPTTEEYSSIVENRNYLAQQLNNKQVFEQEGNEDLNNFANHIQTHFDTSPASKCDYSVCRAIMAFGISITFSSVVMGYMVGEALLDEV